MIIITQEAAKAKKNFSYDIVANINNLKKLKKSLSVFEKKTPIKIYDIGLNKEYKQEILEVRDHLNKTGINPIVGSHKIEFKDIGELYKSKKGVRTVCCGKRLNLNYKNPSHFLCVFSVFVFYLGFTNISGFIFNKGYN
ncbi:MAG: hypothetical protein CMG00_09215 [Candidatus Marinimicrobia bacterium]|nr:hypothetical protein [Candidatus Neomarinimicrobiota bacterium]|tara:strand:- start:2909 stop:3325 length:417 start_codon:yes stop_codon:yes gene_type:complete